MKNFFRIFIGMLFLTSCGVQYKQVPYFQDILDTGYLKEDISNHSILKIQKEDILAITVASLNAEASAIFSRGTTSTIQGPTSGGSDPASAANGFMVDQSGEIQLPMVGSIHVAGLTTSEARLFIQEMLSSYLKEPVVSLKLINFKVSVLGDVGRPGVYPVYNERLTIAEALSLAGDLNITAIRNNVLLVREVDGKRQFVRLDLQQKKIFDSDFFYLKNNDVLYVQPSNAKYASVDSSYRNVGIILSVLSVLALLITQF